MKLVVGVFIFFKIESATTFHLIEGVDHMLLKLWVKKAAFIRSEEGATAIEYGLIAAGIAVAISIIVFTLGTSLANLFGNLNSSLAG